MPLTAAMADSRRRRHKNAAANTDSLRQSPATTVYRVKSGIISPLPRIGDVGISVPLAAAIQFHVAIERNASMTACPRQQRCIAWSAYQPAARWRRRDPAIPLAAARRIEAWRQRHASPQEQPHVC